MKELFTNLTTEEHQELQKTMPIDRLEWFIKTDWSNKSENHRVKIRQALFETLANLNPTSRIDESILDLEIIPNPKEFNASISHCPDAGGYCISPSSIYIGLDLETESRVKETTIQRVCSKEELELSPGNSPLWTAKEACFKTLSHSEDLKTISQIKIDNWKKVSERCFSFSATLTPSSQVQCFGFSFIERSVCLSLAISPNPSRIETI